MVMRVGIEDSAKQDGEIGFMVVRVGSEDSYGKTVFMVMRVGSENSYGKWGAWL